MPTESIWVLAQTLADDGEPAEVELLFRAWFTLSQIRLIADGAVRAAFNGPPIPALFDIGEELDGWASMQSEAVLALMCWACARRLPASRQKGLVVAIMSEWRAAT